MEPIEIIQSRLEAAIPGLKLEASPGAPPARQPFLVVPPAQALEVARWLRDTPGMAFDYCSNVTGVDWLDAVQKRTVRVKQAVGGAEQEVERVEEVIRPGYLEVVYHLYSMSLRHGPLVIRQRTVDRGERVQVASLTPVWRGCEFQEREVFDLYGVAFEGHPDLRRLLMWEGFQGHPMRKDYVPPDDFEYEPTPHDEVLERAQRHYRPEARP